jgi:hypothetical protein
MKSQEDKNKRNIRVRSNNRNNPIIGLLGRAKSRSKKNNIEFLLNKNDISIPSNCPILDLPLYISDNFAKDNFYKTLDRE